jgi:hypothetical protein
MEDLLVENTDVAHRVPGDVALHLRVVHPAIFRIYIPAADLPDYLDMASGHGYSLAVDWRLAVDGAVRLVFTRDDVADRPFPLLRPVVSA